jgi:hypothetical protein
MRLAIDDGFTLEAATKDTLTGPSGQTLAKGLPVVNYRYRPALPEALAEWRYAMRAATSGKAELDAIAKLLADHLVSWDVIDGKGVALPIAAESVRKVPEPILNQLLDTVTTWAPKSMADALGNSPPA